MAFPTRSQFYATVFKQIFVLPDSLIYYISKNPVSPKCYQKMIQTCKYFFIQIPIIVLKTYYSHVGDGDKTMAAQKRLKLKKKCTSKFWITDSFCSGSNKNLSLLLSKIYRFDGKKLHICAENIFYDELLILSSNVEDFDIFKVTVKYYDGSIVPLEKIVEAFPKIKSISYLDSTPSNISSQTFKKLLKIPQFLTLDYCKFWWIPEEFDIESFYAYMKANKHTKFSLEFSYPLSEAYKNRLEEIVDEIIEDKNHDYKPPYMYFLGLNFEKDKILKEIYLR